MPSLGLLFPGEPRDPRTWSGTPAGLARGLAEAGVDVRTVRTEPSRALDAAARYGVAVLRLHRTARRGLRPTLQLSRAVARASPELGSVHTWAARRSLRRAGPLDGLVQIGTGYTLPAGPPIATFEDITVKQAVALGYPEWRILSARAVRVRTERQRAAYARAAVCCVATSWAGDSLVGDYGVPREKVHVVGVGRNHSPRPVPRDWTSPRFLFVGRDWEGKNGPAVLRAFARVREEVPSARLDVVGWHPRLDAAGVEGHGFLRQEVADDRRRLEGLYEGATCFVLPSRFEAAGIVYAEAGAAGIPSIGTTAGGCADFVGPAGRLVHPDDDAGLLAAMRELARPDVAARLGALALERAPLFTWRAVAERVLRALALP
jgi:glycosyltransferase involved in cell wall biosynthesis